MNRFFTKKARSGNKGFTLIELLVVIAIIGVLASIVLASLNSARKKSRDARRITDIKQIQLALELYYDGTSSQYPASSTGAGNCNATTLAYGLEALSAGGYIPQISRDPNNTGVNLCYWYAAPTAVGTRNSYHLGAILEEGTNPALAGDKDCNSTTALPTVGSCGSTIYTNPFVGTDPTYDVIP